MKYYRTEEAEVKCLGKYAFLPYVVAAMAVAVSCFAIGGGAARGTKGDRMVDTNKSVGKTSQPIDFEFRFSSVGGPVLGTDVHERQSLLTLDGLSGTAFFEKHRSESDAEQEPIGLFQGALETSWLVGLQRLVDSLGLQNLAPSSGGGLGASLLTFTYRSSEQSYSKTITNFDGDQVTTIEPLLIELYKKQVTLHDSAVSAITASVNPSAGGSTSHFLLTIRNIGRAPVLIADPRWVDSTADCWAGVRFAVLPTEVPGVTSPPLHWEHLMIEPSREDRPDNIDLLVPPGSEISFPTRVWRPERHGVSYLVQGVYSSYLGDGSFQGMYRIRGAVFSKAIEVAP